VPERLAVAVVGWEGILRADGGAHGPEVKGVGAGVLDYGVATRGGVGCVGEDERVCGEEFVGWAVMTAAVMTASMMATSSVVGRATAVMATSSMMVAAAMMWGAVVVGGFFQVCIGVGGCVHGHGLVALVVLVGVGIFGVHDAVFQVHVGDCVGGWVEAVHAMGHGQGETQEKDEEYIHLVGVSTVCRVLTVDAVNGASSWSPLRSYIFRSGMGIDEMHKGSPNVAVQPSRSTSITIQTVIEWCNILVTIYNVERKQLKDPQPQTSLEAHLPDVPQPVGIHHS